MPTGYTYSVADGKITTLREFAFECARAMGALIMMRDEPHDAPIPEKFEPSTAFHDERIAVARALVDELQALTSDQCEERAQVDYNEKLAAHEKYVGELKEQDERIRAMMARVSSWQTKADGIRSFMLEQLRISLNDYKPTPPAKLSASDWRRERFESAARDLGYHETERAKEISRTDERNRWLADLRDSLPPESAK